MNIYNTLLKEQIELFKYKFKLISKELFIDPQRKTNNSYFHSGEFGTYRENICRQFLKFFVHQRFEIGSGFVITPQQCSTQQDLIIYDKSHVPRIESHEYQRFYPIEAVAAVGEVKSVIYSWEALRETLVKLSTTKQLRESLYPSVSIVYPPNDTKKIYNPQNYLYDQLFTFLICEDVLTNKHFDEMEFFTRVDGIYENANIAYRNRHNLILILNKGIIMYLNHDKTILHYPCFPAKRGSLDNANLANYYVQADDKYIHFRHFMNSMCMGSSSVRILYPEIRHYVF